MNLYKKMCTNPEILNKLEAFNVLTAGHKQVLLSILNNKYDINIDKEKFEFYINEYAEAFAGYNVYFNAVSEQNIPPHPYGTYYNTTILFRDDTIHIDVDDNDTEYINLLLKNGFKVSSFDNIE